MLSFTYTGGNRGWKGDVPKDEVRYRKTQGHWMEACLFFGEKREGNCEGIN